MEGLACTLRLAEVVPMRAVEFARGWSCAAERKKVEPWAVMAPQKRLKSLQPSALSQDAAHEAVVAHSGVSALITVQVQTIPIQCSACFISAPACPTQRRLCHKRCALICGSSQYWRHDDGNATAPASQASSASGRSMAPASRPKNLYLLYFKEL